MLSLLGLLLGLALLVWLTMRGVELLIAAPLFILLGEIILRAGIAQKMYRAVSQWLTWLPGGLMHANIGTCALFAATSGSSVATAATVGVAAYPEIERHQYNERLFLGSIAAGGTRGILIPPSINFILYGVLTETSIPELYLAGIVPGLLLAALFMLAILVACLFRPQWGGKRIETSWRQRFAGLPDGIFRRVDGGLFAGARAQRGGPGHAGLARLARLAPVREAGQHAHAFRCGVGCGFAQEALRVCASLAGAEQRALFGASGHRQRPIGCKPRCRGACDECQRRPALELA